MFNLISKSNNSTGKSFVVGFCCFENTEERMLKNDFLIRFMNLNVKKGFNRTKKCATHTQSPEVCIQATSLYKYSIV